MNAIDLKLALAMERLILGSSLRLECNCILKVLCTMPITLWMRILKYEHRCPRHPRGSRHIFKQHSGPVWVDIDGRLIDRDEFREIFNKLAADGFITLTPGFTTDHGRTKLPSLLSMEGTHLIIEAGNTQNVHERR